MIARPLAHRLERRGISLVEVPVALVLLELGLLGCAGLLVVAQRHMTAAERLHAATQSAAGLADSLQSVRATGGGEAAFPWGTLRWSAAGDGSTVTAHDPGGVPVLEWWVPYPPGPR